MGEEEEMMKKRKEKETMKKMKKEKEKHRNVANPCVQFLSAKFPELIVKIIC